MSDLEVLYADADPQFRQNVDRYLDRADEPLSLHVETAGAAALAHLRDTTVECAVVGAELDDIDGLSLLHELQVASGSVPVVFLTDTTQNDVLAFEALSAGAFDYIEKGTWRGRPSVLVDRIKAAVKRERDRPEATMAPDRIEEKLQEEISARRQAQRRLRTLLDRIPNPIFYKERGGEYTGCNEAFEEFIGLSREEIVGKTVFEMGPEEIAQKYHEKDEELFQNPGVQRYEWQVDSDEGLRDVIFDKATFSDNEGEVAGLVGVIQDITEQKRREEQLAYEARHDGLTDLYNRKALEQQVEEPLSTDDSDPPLRALIYIDLDDFKAVNDTFGHDQGDEVLVQTAGALESVVRDDDAVGRVGGDEFAVYLGSLDDEATARQIAERLHEALGMTIERDGHTVSVSASLGLITGLSAYASFEEILQAADAAMYEAKEHGRATTHERAG